MQRETQRETPTSTHTHTRKWCGCRCWCPPQHNKPKCKQCVRSQQAHLNKPYRHLVKKTQFLASKTDTSPRPEMFTCWQWCNNEFLLTCVQDMLDTFLYIYLYTYTHTQVVHIYPHTHTYTQSQTEVQIHNHSLLCKERHKEKPPHLRTHTHESDVVVDVDVHLSITSQSASNVLDLSRHILTSHTDTSWRKLSFLRQKLIPHRDLRCSHADNDATMNFCWHVSKTC